MFVVGGIKISQNVRVSMHDNADQAQSTPCHLQPIQIGDIMSFELFGMASKLGLQNILSPFNTKLGLDCRR